MTLYPRMIHKSLVTVIGCVRNVEYLRFDDSLFVSVYLFHTRLQGVKAPSINVDLFYPYLLFVVGVLFSVG